MIDYYLSPAEQAEVDVLDLEAGAIASVWVPNPDDGKPNPQRLALESQADELFYGGQAGGGKTDLLLGCPVLHHSKSVVFRRTSPNLKSVIERSTNILGETGYHKTNKRHDLGRGRFLEFGYMQHEEDKKNWQGRDHDFYGFDEITEFTRSQYQFVIGWNRTTKKGQRCRVICVGNPPIDSDGTWVIEEWAPWLDPDFYDPAEPAELRWYYYDEAGRLQWQRDNEPVEVNGEFIRPISRTFIPAGLQDNPHLAEDGRYAQRLNSLPEPLRSAFRDGNFRAISQQGDPMQVIPTAWVRAAQRRFLGREKPSGSPDAGGHDPSRGGRDDTTNCNRWGDYFGEIDVWPGSTIKDGPTAALRVHEANRGLHPKVINVDIIGYGSSSYDSLVGMGYNCRAVNVSAKSNYKDASGMLTMYNLRAELYWRMRDALDPANNSTIALPDDAELLRDLCSARYVPMAGGKVKVESKEEIKKRIGRSPGRGDAVLLANYDKQTGSSMGVRRYA